MSTSTLTSDTLSFVCDLVRQRSAIELDASKSYLVDARLAPLMKQHGFSTTSDLIQSMKVKKQPELERRLVEAMTTNETSFYRDLHPFEALRKTLIPDLQKIKASQRTINIWSAACSSGQELYSVIMLMREHFPELATWKLELIGTDLSDDILERAREGKFSQIEVNRGLPATMLVKYFDRQGMHWTLRPEIRALATFKKLNLIETWPTMPQMDVVFLRNVLIYFAPEIKKQILQKVRKVMAPHGVLFLGAAETTMNLDTSFERVQIESSVFYRLKS